MYTKTASNERDISDKSLAILLIHGSTSLQHSVSPCAPIRWIHMESITISQSNRKCEPWKCQNPSPEHNKELGALHLGHQINLVQQVRQLVTAQTQKQSLMRLQKLQFYAWLSQRSAQHKTKI